MNPQSEYNRQLMDQIQAAANAAYMSKSDPTRHKCFISYHVADKDEVKQFVEDFGSEFIPRTVGVTDEDDFIDSEDEDYIKGQIRSKYLSDSTVTIVLLGAGTYGRKYVDWEISATLRDDSVNHRSGLLLITLPSVNGSTVLPARARDNWVEGNPSASYAIYHSYPTSLRSLRDDIELAYQWKNSKGDLVKNSRELKKNNTT
jgi:hypothetical protein